MGWTWAMWRWSANPWAAGPAWNTRWSGRRVRALVLAATTGTLDHAKMREPERGMLEAWRSRSAPCGAELVARGIHPAGGAALAARDPALHLLYRRSTS
jgi:hypothetical protein